MQVHFMACKSRSSGAKCHSSGCSMWIYDSVTERHLKVVLLRAVPIRTTNECALPSLRRGLRTIKAAYSNLQVCKFLACSSLGAWAPVLRHVRTACFGCRHKDHSALGRSTDACKAGGQFSVEPLGANTKDIRQCLQAIMLEDKTQSPPRWLIRYGTAIRCQRRRRRYMLR